MLINVEKQDCYIQHLVAMSERFNITLSDDVLNQQGAILVPKGGRLDEALVNKISTHHLLRPLENCVLLQNQLYACQLKVHFQNIFLKFDDFALFNERSDLSALLKESCEYYQEFPIIVQKMTVLKERLPHLFKQSLFCAYVSLAIAKHLGLNTEDCKSSFLAGLIHDIGILHLDAELLQKKGEYTPKQWHAMHSHTVIAHKLLVSIKTLPKRVSMAVLEHHEHFDGSGYPFSKKGKKLGVMGQIIGMADTCLALYKRDLAHKNLGFDALLPVLQVNPDIYCRSVFNATIELIRSIPWPEKRVYADDRMPEIISRLVLESEIIHHDYTVLYSMVTSIRPHLPNNKKATMLKNMAARIHKSLTRSGILQREHNEWMLVISETKSHEDYRAIERLEVMYSEIKWQMKQLQKLLFLLWEKHQFKHPKLHAIVQKGLWQIAQHQKKTISSTMQ